MPQKAPRVCGHAGCGAITRGRYCAKHQRMAEQRQKARRQRIDRNRPSARQRGYTKKWERARAAFLRAHPLCKECDRLGIVGAATIVDHIIPHRGDMQLFWDETNWQALCKPHHDQKTAREEGTWARR